MNFDTNQIKEWINRVEDDIAHFPGFEFALARIIANISRQHALGELDDGQAAQLLRDAQHLAMLVKLGHRYARWVRNPPAEVEIMVLADQARQRRKHETKKK